MTLVKICNEKLQSLWLVQRGVCCSKSNSNGFAAAASARMFIWTWFTMPSPFAACTPPTATVGKASTLPASTKRWKQTWTATCNVARLRCENQDSQLHLLDVGCGNGALLRRAQALGFASRGRRNLGPACLNGEGTTSLRRVPAVPFRIGSARIELRCCDDVRFD